MRGRGLGKVLAVILTVAFFTGICACSGKPQTAQSKADATQMNEAQIAATQADAAQTDAAQTDAAQADAAQADAAQTSATQADAAQKDTDKSGEESGKTEITVFIAASLSRVMEKVAEAYAQTNPNVKILFNADSSGTLMTQIKEGYACDVFFSAAQKQMDTLEKDGFLVDGTRHNVVNNQLVVVTRKDSGTKVTGISSLSDAESIALADGSVPVGRYTRIALMRLGILPETEEPADYTTQQVSEALGGVEISEQGNVSKVLTAVVEASCEVGTTYYSDTFGYEDELDILETVGYDLTGNVIYPVAAVKNEEADEAQAKAAEDFVNFISSDAAKEIFQAYYFDTDVE